MSERSSERQTLTNHTRVSVALAATVLAGIVAGVMEWDATRAEIKQLQRSQWTVTDQLQWTYEFQKRNQTVDVPIPAVRGDAQPAQATRPPAYAETITNREEP